MGIFILSDNQLREAYNQAKKMDLDKEFIKVLEKEMKLRKLSEKAKTL
ncbi:sporulation histidine kinase inhibitor Sda [Domibacillus sp. DTU_2020_1001157_1_SI_ALB_TIR_016]|nr:sporulation histidine kinase inhibitor Sda [Domibacillus sp. DTU_2020_1001157_1_SI_ALB_TIR_016]WNS78750.1 sporulation histidine kinase inhibitor Sda [Domibacillus sp. DTU_2020_1001157_1_SI_ALB_TIR_016]